MYRELFHIECCECSSVPVPEFLQRDSRIFFSGLTAERRSTMAVGPKKAPGSSEQQLQRPMGIMDGWMGVWIHPSSPTMAGHAATLLLELLLHLEPIRFAFFGSHTLSAYTAVAVLWHIFL